LLLSLAPDRLIKHRESSPKLPPQDDSKSHKHSDNYKHHESLRQGKRVLNEASRILHVRNPFESFEASPAVRQRKIDEYDVKDEEK
jgi:hypothetical protein